MATTLKLAPEPKEKHWLFGSAYYLRNNPHQQAKRMIETYGDVVRLTLPMHKVSIVGKPEYAKYILLDNNKNYRKSLAYEMLSVLLGNGLLTSEGDFWKQQRKLIQPAFHKRKLEAMMDMMVELGNKAKDEIAANKDTYFDVLPLMTRLTLDIISKAMFSNGVEDKADIVCQQITLLNEYAIKKLNQPIRLPAAFPTPFNVRERKAIELLDKVVYDIIDTRRKSGESKDDLLSMLIDLKDEDTGQGMDNKQLRDELMTIFIAGNETTANAMTWLLYLLSQNPAEEAKMIKEIDEKWGDGNLDVMKLQEFQYVRQCIDEAMRLRPAAWSVGRRNYEDDEIGGYHIEKNTNILIPIWYFHTSERWWDEPLKYKPERFAPEIRNNIDRFVFMPFGAGPRFCIGNNFALMEMQIITILLYKHFRFELQPGFNAEPEPLITLRPKNGMVMKAVRR